MCISTLPSCKPHNKTLNDAPIRLYGVVPVKVVIKNTVLNPVIQMPDRLTPNQKVSIKVSEKSGKPMTYTVAIVEDGLLNLTRFKTPNPWNTFFSKTALGVKNLGCVRRCDWRLWRNYQSGV